MGDTRSIMWTSGSSYAVQIYDDNARCYFQKREKKGFISAYKHTVHLIIPQV